MGLKGLLAKGKDKALAVAIKTAVNSKIEKFGHVSNLDVDTQGKNLEVRVSLKGEPDPVQVRISGYDIIREGKDCFISAAKVVASREWMNILFGQYFENRKLKVPEEHAKYLDIVG